MEGGGGGEGTWQGGRGGGGNRETRGPVGLERGRGLEIVLLHGFCYFCSVWSFLYFCHLFVFVCHGCLSLSGRLALFSCLGDLHCFVAFGPCLGDLPFVCRFFLYFWSLSGRLACLLHVLHFARRFSVPSLRNNISTPTLLASSPPVSSFQCFWWKQPQTKL